MPMYIYHCSQCEHEYQLNVRIADYQKEQPCPKCETPNKKVFQPTRNFILKGDGWAGKNNRIKNQMRKKNERLDARTNEMKRDAPSVTLAPNVNGERVDSWSDAQKLAKSQWNSTESYEPHIAKEKESKK